MKYAFVGGCAHRVLVEHARFWVSLDGPGLFLEWLRKQREARGLSGVEVMSILLGENGIFDIKEVIGEMAAERALSRMRMRPDAWKSIRVMRAMWHDPESSHRLRETVFPESITASNSSTQGQQQHHADEDEEHDEEEEDNTISDNEDEHTRQQDIPEESPRTGNFEFEPESHMDIREPVEGFVLKSPLVDPATLIDQGAHVDPVQHNDNDICETATMVTERANSIHDLAEHQVREGGRTAAGTLLGDMLIDEQDEKGTQGTKMGSSTSPPPCKE